MATPELLNSSGLLSVALIPEWVDQDPVSADDMDGPPATVNAGVALSSGAYSIEGTPKAMFHVSPRGDHVHRREALVTVDTFDAAATWTTTLDGTAISKGASATEDIALIGLRDAILADATVGGAAGANQVVTAVCLDSDGAVTTGTVAGGNAAVSLEVQGTVPEDFSIAVGATGTGVLDCTADAVSLDVQLWLLPGGIIQSGSEGNAGGWTKPSGGSFEAVDQGGIMDRADVAGCSRLYVEVRTIAGHASDGAEVVPTIAKVMVGPSVLEATI